MAERTGDIDIERISSSMGFDELPEVLEAAATPIRRGHHLALLAAEGSGKASVVALAALETCDPEAEGVQALVLVPDARPAWRTAADIQRAVGPAGLRVACPAAAPAEDRPADSVQVGADAPILVGRPSRLLPDIRAGLRSIAELRLLVIDGVADLRALDEWGSVEPILETLPEGCRKIAVSSRLEPAFTELVERQLPRARRWPE
ncbi:MAG: DEAD/DEAH box helicase, partial [Gemmatimonadota bacterium]